MLPNGVFGWKKLERTMKIPRVLAVTGLGLGLLVLPGLAHHSTNDIYNEAQTVEVTGKVLEWRLVNPHPYLVVEVTGPDGRAEKWDLSFGGSAVAPLRRRGYTAASFKPGEVVIARGNPARSKNFRGILIRGGITREDGTPIP
jgi:hypothetical protein